MNVLIIDDEEMVAKAIKNMLIDLPMVNVIEITHDFKTGFEKAYSGVFDLLLVDIGLGEESQNGLDLVAHIRQSSPDLPIIISTSYHSFQYLERAFELGVNDYLKKPFHPKELALRVKRWFATHKPSVSPADLRYGDLFYNAQRHEFFSGNEKLVLTKRNKDLLLLFLKEPEKLLNRHYLREKFWGDYSDRPRNIRSNIQELRRALGEPYSAWIKTIRGEGYLLQNDDKGP